MRSGGLMTSTGTKGTPSRRQPRMATRKVVSLWPEIVSGTPAVAPARRAFASQAGVAAFRAPQVDARCADSTATASARDSVSAKS
ncbi:hypothetical protein G6F22_021543 [Rhizopus arrhizus]|nr:hypothetical protein G6F22_021543 [Rhizopus arrhizus]